MRLTWQRLTADRKRFGLFCTLLFVGLLLWARIIVISRPPRTAVAITETEVAALVPVSSDNAKVSAVFETMPAKNPFVINNKVFPSELLVTDNTLPHYVDNSIQAEQEIVAGLTLDAILGEMAMINGRVIKQGDVVAMHDVPDPLRLTSLSGRSVIISAGNRRYELTIAHPHR